MPEQRSAKIVYVVVNYDTEVESIYSTPQAAEARLDWLLERLPPDRNLGWSIQAWKLDVDGGAYYGIRGD